MQPTTQASRNLTSLLTGAGTAIVALSSVTMSLVLSEHAPSQLSSDQRLFIIILASSISTIMVMSLLHSDLGALYKRLETSERKAQDDARTDPLTSLGNRRFIIGEIERLLDQHSQTAMHALLFLDLDDFKSVNDTLGHFSGDNLIAQVARRLTTTLPSSTVGRLGGDEFAVVLKLSSPDELAGRCKVIEEELSGTYLIGGSERNMGVSIGATVFDSTLDTAEMMRRADIAMYAAKETKSGYRIFDQAMLLEDDRRNLIEGRLRFALASGQGLSLAFQPQVTPAGKKIRREALVRWHDDVIGEVAPMELVRVAEAAHLIDDVGLFVAGKACEAVENDPSLATSINISRIQLLHREFPEQLIAVLHDHVVPAEMIGLEIPEVVFSRDGERIAQALKKLKSHGFKIFVDNYGTSSTSITYLKRFGVDGVKLAPSIIGNAKKYNNIAVMRSMVLLCRSLDLEVCCAGIADQNDMDIAIRAGCEVLQGFSISEPAPIAPSGNCPVELLTNSNGTAEIARSA